MTQKRFRELGFVLSFGLVLHFAAAAAAAPNPPVDEATPQAVAAQLLQVKRVYVEPADRRRDGGADARFADHRPARLQTVRAD